MKTTTIGNMTAVNHTLRATLLLALFASAPALHAQGPDNHPRLDGTVKAAVSTDLAPVFARQMHYWGGMLKHGADTFWQVYVPGDDRRSRYGSHLMNSYCHAWSCTPT